MERYISGRLKKAMFVLFVCLTAFSISHGLILITTTDFGFGNIAKAFSPGSVCIVGLLFFARPDLFPLGLRSYKIGFKEGLFIIFLSSFVVLFLLPWIEALSHLIGVLIALIGLLTAIHLTITRDDVWGMVVFILTEPFLSFVQWDILFLRSIYDSGYISISYISMLLIMGTAAARMLKESTLVRTALDKYVVAFMLILLLSSITSPDRPESFKTFFQIVIVGIPFFFIVSSRIQSKKDIMLLLGTFVLYGVLKGLMINYLLLKGLGFSFLDLVEVRGGLVSNPKAPLYLDGPIPIAISMAIIYSRSSIKQVCYYALAVLFFLFLIFVSQTRGSLITLAAGTPILFFYRCGKRWVVAGIVGMALLMLASNIAPIFFQRYGELISLQGWERALSMRLDGWRVALDMMRDHPFTGVGLGMWEEFIHIYATPFKWMIEGRSIYVYITSAHQGFIQYGAEAGVGAFVLLLLIILRAQLATFYVMKRAEDEDIHTVAVGLAWTCIGFLIWGMYAYPRGYVDYAIGSWGLLAIIMGLERIAKAHTMLNEIATNINRTKGKKLI